MIKAETYKNRENFFQRTKTDIKKNYALYLIFLPVLIYYLIFHYGPMYGLVIAFKDYRPIQGIFGSEWAGLAKFKEIFESPLFFRALKNTLNISVQSIIFSFPAPIILALLINEIENIRFKRVVQSISYMPHFISLVVVAGMIRVFVSDVGFINRITTALGMTTGENMLSVKEYFVPIYVISGLWQEVGWGTIIYLSALSSIDKELYEAATVDGANKFQQVIRITIPGIMSTIIMLFVLKIGGLMSVGYEKIILLYNPVIYDSADVISSFVYRKGLLEADYSFSTAVGIFNSVINFILLITANWISRKFDESSIW